MSIERQPWGNEPERQQPDFEFIAEIASENILAHGFHPPTIIVHGSRGSTVAQFESLSDTHQERLRTMFFVGKDLARRVEIGALEQVYLISEAWMSKPKEDGTVDLPPSEDPNRLEVLIISGVDLLAGMKQRMALFELIRDENEKLSDTRRVEIPVSVQPEKIESPLLNAFVNGYRQAFSKFN